MLVLAGPGSGKTFVIIQRLLYLIREKQVREDSILVISFSKASTWELKQRFQKQSEAEHLSVKSSKEKRQVNFSTFHAFFFHILKETYHYTSKDIITEPQKRELLKIILSDPAFYEQSIQQKDSIEESKISNLSEKIEEYLQKISYYKNKDKKEIEKEESEQFQKIFHAYNKEMHQKHKLDFDDMGLLCLQLLKKDPFILKKWQEKIRYIMIDEFQDINMVQFRIVQLLAAEHGNLFVVGDDDQSIYSFRGASPQIMLDFRNYYPESKSVLLETNYRCNKMVVQESLKVIEKNKMRLKKQIRAKERNENTKENAVVYKEFESYRDEYEYLLEKIREKVKKTGCAYSEIACIFRTNQDMMGLAETFVRNKLPFSMKESCNSIFKHFIALDLLAYLQFFLEGKNRADFFRIMNKPMRYFSRHAIQERQVQWKTLKKYYVSKPYMIRNIEQLEQKERWIQKLDLYGACFYIRKVVGYDAYLKEYCKENGIVWKEAEEILDFIQGSIKGMGSLEEWKNFIKEYEDALKKAPENEKDGVQLITYHACKGLEYKVVFLPDCNEGKVPHKKAASTEEIEEERRMFYVAMTRAKEQLEILYQKDKLKNHLQPSRFLPLRENLPFIQKF